MCSIRLRFSLMPTSCQAEGGGGYSFRFDHPDRLLRLEPFKRFFSEDNRLLSCLCPFFLTSPPRIYCCFPTSILFVDLHCFQTTLVCSHGLSLVTPFFLHSRCSFCDLCPSLRSLKSFVDSTALGIRVELPFDQPFISGARASAGPQGALFPGNFAMAVADFFFAFSFFVSFLSFLFFTPGRCNLFFFAV